MIFAAPSETMSEGINLTDMVCNNHHFGPCIAAGLTPEQLKRLEPSDTEQRIQNAHLVLKRKVPIYPTRLVT